MTAPMLAPTLVPMSSSPYSMVTQPMASSSRHILARMSNSICLLETSATPSSPEVVDVYTHEFAGVFRFSHTTSIYKGDYTLLEALDEDSMVSDDEHAVVIVSREIMALVARKTMPLPLPSHQKRHSTEKMRMPQPVRPTPTRRVVRGWNAGL